MQNVINFFFLYAGCMFFAYSTSLQMKTSHFILLTMMFSAMKSNAITDSSRCFGLGLSVGLRNTNGLGMLIFYRQRHIEMNIGIGGTFYNGTKLSAGMKAYLPTGHKIKPFLFLNYTYTLHENIHDDRNTPPSYSFTTSDNQYAIGGAGFFLSNHKGRTEHHFSLGYTQALNAYSIISDSRYTNDRLFKAITNATQSGVMFSYSIYFLGNSK